MYFSSATATCPSRIPSMYRPTALLSLADTIDLREASTSLYGQPPWQLSNKTTPGASLSGREYHVSYWPNSAVANTRLGGKLTGDKLTRPTPAMWSAAVLIRPGPHYSIRAPRALRRMEHGDVDNHPHDEREQQ